MKEHTTQYLVVGAGLAGASAVEGIREMDSSGSITMVGAETQLPYHRPPLSKKLWSGAEEVKDIFLRGQDFYDSKGVTLSRGRRIVRVDPQDRIAADSSGESYRYGKLLLATGGAPRTLTIPGGDIPGIYYYRSLADYEPLRSEAVEGKSALVIGGGFIGSEMAAALRMNRLDVTMLYPSEWLCSRVFPEDLGLAMERKYEERGIRILKRQEPVSIRRNGSRFVTQTRNGGQIASDLIIVGIGIEPGVELAQKAGLSTGDGIIVDEWLRTSDPHIYAAGDNARFPYQALAQQVRVEHWDNALNQGRWAGRNMAGAREPYTYMPFFFSDLFEFGYEAVGEINSRMEMASEWQKPYDTGVIYYMRDRKIRGAMMCNVWEKVETARQLIRSGARPEQASIVSV